MPTFNEIAPLIDDSIAMQPKENLSLGKIARDVAGFAIGMAVLKRATGFAAKSIFKSVASKPIGRGISDVLGKSSETLSKGLSLGELTKGTIGAYAKDPSMGRTASNISQVLQAGGRGAKQLHSSLAGSKNIGARALGYAAKTYVKSAPVAAGFYTISRIFNPHKEEDQAAWYNVPGHIKAIGKMTAEFAVFDGAMHGLKKAGSALGSKAISYLQEKDNPGLHRFVDKTIGMRRTDRGLEPGSFASKVIKTAAIFDGIREAGSAASAHINVAAGKLFGNKLARDAKYSELFDFKKKAFYSNLTHRAKDGFKSGYNSRMSKVHGMDTTYGASALNSLTDLLAKHHNTDAKTFSERIATGSSNKVISQVGSKPITEGFANAWSEEVKRASKIAEKSFGGKLGRTYAKMSDVLEHNATQRAQSDKIWSYVRENSDLAKAEVDNMENTFKSMYAGRNVFKSHGSIIDYSMYTPKNMLSSITSFVTPFLNISVPFTGGKTLPIGKLLNMERFLQKEGLNIGSIGTNDKQYYRDMAEGGKGNVRRVGDTLTEHGGSSVESANISGLGGVLIDNELFVHTAMGGLKKAITPRMKLISASPYARESVLYKLHSDAASQGVGESVEYMQKIAERNKAKGGFFNKLDKFITNRGLKAPDMLTSLSTKLQSAFGFGPKTMAVKDMADYVTGIKDQASLSRVDFTSMMSAIPMLGEDASKNLYGQLSDPKMLRAMGKLASKNGYGANHVGKFEELANLMRSSDDDFMSYMTKYNAGEYDPHIKHAIELNSVGKYSMNDPVGFKFGQMPLNNKRDLHRRLINQAMGKVYQQGSAGGSSINFAEVMLKDNDIIKSFSKAEVNDLHKLAATTNLHTAGFLGKEGTYFSTTEESRSMAVDLIKDHLKIQRGDLEKSLYDTPLIHGVGFFNSAKSSTGEGVNLEEAFQRLRNQRNPLNDNAGSHNLLVEAEGGFLRGVNYYVDRVMAMGTHVGFKYGIKERGDGYIGFNGAGIDKLVSFLPKGAQAFVKSPLEKLTSKRYYVGGPLKQLGRRVAQGVGVLAAAQALDTFVDVNPMFNGTAFDKGIFVPAAETYAKASMAFHKVQDMSGITQAAKYLDGLMPGSLSTLPGAIIGGMTRGPLGILSGAVINRSMDALGLLPKFDKSYDEMADQYSGRELVPVKRNRFWLFSKAPYEGDGPQYFRPHWLPKLKSQYKYSDTLYGSKAEAFLFKPWAGIGFNPLGHIIDKYHYEKKHYWDRPYPITEGAFSDASLIGPILSSTVGRLPIIGKPAVLMHEAEMSGYYSKDGSNTTSETELSTSHMRNPDAESKLMFMNKKGNLAADQALYGRRPANLNPYGALTVLGEQAYNFTEFVGLPGFKMETLMGGHPGDFNKRLSTSSEMWSTRRAFWDMNMGDYFASTELFRRFVPKEKKVWEKVNPIRNRMAPWLPSESNDYMVNFLEGDPFTKVAEGEIRLPGAAYNRLYDVKRTFPGRASSLGKGVVELVKSMAGLDAPDTEDAEDIMAAGTAIHNYMQDSMIRANVGYKAEQLVYDQENDISGHIDLLMYDPYIKGGKRPLEIKTMSGKKFGKSSSPLPNHMSQLNFYLKQMQMEVGTLLYINRDDPTQIRTFDVRYNEDRYRRDMQDMRKARAIAAKLMIQGKGTETGASYSWVDRLRILSDIAPYSKEYKEAKTIVNLQIGANKLPESAKEEVATIARHRSSSMRKYELYPTRFRGRVFDPDINYELQSENTNIKAAANYSFGERLLGSLWERAIQMDTPLNTKLWNYQSPLQHYERTRIYGTESASWNRSYQDLIKPMFTKGLSSRNPIDAAASFGWIGAVGLGGMGNMGLPGAVFGSLYGATKALVGNDGWIPGEVKKKREIEKTFDQLKYAKNMNLYQNTGDERYRTAAANTMWSISQNSYDVSTSQALKSISNFEKPYFLSWMKESNPIERERILEMVPDDVGNLLKSKWGLSYDAPTPSKYESMIPDADWEGLANNDNLNDIKLKTIEQAGLRTHDFGMGWFDQQRRIASSTASLDPVQNTSDVLYSSNSAAKIKATLMQYLGSLVKRPLISISITPAGENHVKLQLNLMRNRYNEIQNAMKVHR